MIRFLQRLFGPKASPARRTVARSARLGVEHLEERAVMSVTPGLAANTSYEVFPDHSLYRHVGLDFNTGWTKVPVATASVSIGRESSIYGTAPDVEVQYILDTGANLWSHAGTTFTDSIFNGNWHLLARDVKEVSASTAPGTTRAYVVFNNSTLFEHVGTDYYSGWSSMASGVNHVSAGISTQDKPACFVQDYSGNVNEFANAYQVGSTDYFYHYAIDWNVKEMSASRVAADTLYDVSNLGNLWLHVGLDINTGFSQLGSSVWTHVSAGLDYAGKACCFAVNNNNDLWAIFGNSATANHFFLDANVKEINASQTQAVTAYEVLFSGQAYEHITTDPNVHYFIWSGF